MMAVGCLVAALDGIEAPRARRRALFWLAFGHSLLFLVVLSQRLAVWHGDEGKLALLVLFGSVFAFFFHWSGADVDTSCRDQLTTLFGSGDGAETLEQRYQRQIRAAALQEERHRLGRDLHDSVKQQIFVIQTAAATAQARFDTDPPAHAMPLTRSAAPPRGWLVTPIRVVPVDGHRVVARSLQAYLESFPDIEVAATAASGEERLRTVDAWKPAIVIQDLLLLGGIDGIETTRRLRARRPAVAVIALTASTDEARMVGVLRAGAQGYVPKDGDPEILLAAVRAVARGRTFRRSLRGRPHPL